MHIEIEKKRTFRSLWIQRINAGIRKFDMSYSVFIGKLNKTGIGLNRKACRFSNEPS